jgi:hypothetical protein
MLYSQNNLNNRGLKEQNPIQTGFSIKVNVIGLAAIY